MLLDQTLIRLLLTVLLAGAGVDVGAAAPAGLCGNGIKWLGHQLPFNISVQFQMFMKLQRKWSSSNGQARLCSCWCVHH